MGRHVWFRTPTKDDRLDILDLYIGKVSHEADLDSPKRRDEIARIMSGYSPAMIEQAISMALTMAHHDGRVAFGWDDLVEALTTLDAGTAVGSEHVGIETRSVAIHEAGHAVAGHLYVKGAESARLTIKKRGETGGHHWMIQKEDRMFAFQHEMFADVVHTLGAMAAERVFYGENTSGVGGDVQSVTWRTARMVGGAAMGPQPFTVTPKEGQTEEQAREEVLRRFERIGLQIMSRSGGGPFDPDPISGVLSDPSKRTVAAQILGQAYVTAHNVAKTNRAGIDRIADVLEARLEIMGDELIELLDTSGPRRSPSSTWPTRRRGRRPSSPPPSAAAAQQAPRPRPHRGEDVSDATLPNEPAARVHRRRAGAAGRAERRVERRAGSEDEPPRAPTGPAARATTRGSSAVYVGLALVAGIGVGALVASIMRGDTTAEAAPTAARSSRRSRAGASSAQVELAESVAAEVPAPERRRARPAVDRQPEHAPGRQGRLLRVRFQAVQPFDAAGDPDTRSSCREHAIQYSLCGLGRHVRDPGRPPRSPGIGLLKRQGLELAAPHVPERRQRRQRRRLPRSGPVGRHGLAGLHDGVRPQGAQSQRARRSSASPFGKTLPGDAKRITESRARDVQLKKIDKLTRAYTYQYRYKVHRRARRADPAAADEALIPAPELATSDDEIASGEGAARPLDWWPAPGADRARPPLRHAVVLPAPVALAVRRLRVPLRDPAPLRRASRTTSSSTSCATSGRCSTGPCGCR